MKKTLLSIFALSSIALSNSTIAAEYDLAPQQIEINGQVDSNNSCAIDVLERVINLDNVNTTQFDDITGLPKIAAKNISIQFSNCSPNLDKANVIIPSQDEGYFKNTYPEKDRSNIAIAVVNSENNIMRNLSDGSHITKNIDKDNHNATITIPVNYYNPIPGTPVTPGKVAASVTLDINVSNED
ncbi:fimbrial protein [Proteus cibi]|uniref:fimbrial protein n=1 Tax=Proteus cibi TaxID=2050966 RepID=UPI0032DB34F2